jgi:hypothetical protein
MLCPNCKEEVPKTLYCLNCGFPLYKDEELDQEKTERLEAEVKEEEQKAEAPVDAVEPTQPAVDEIEATAAQETPEVETEPTVEVPELVEESPTPVVEPVIEAVVEDVAPEPQSEPVEVTAPVVEDEAEKIIAQITEQSVEEVEAPHEEVAPAEVETVELGEETIVEAEEVKEPEEAGATEKEEELETEKAPEEIVAEPEDRFSPDPLVAEVMENLAKNFSLKVRLVKLLKDDDIKESTFNKLFERYSAAGDRWMNRRNEILERNKFDVETMEKTLTEAKTGLEELEIRRTIGDTTDEEYAAKSPAFQWDICSMEDKLQKRKAEIEYLGGLESAMSTAEAIDLKEIAEGCHGDLNDIENSGTMSSDTASRVKATLEETLELLKSSGCTCS